MAHSTLTARGFAFGMLALALAGCGGGPSDTTVANILAFNTPSAPPAPKTEIDPSEIDCPAVEIRDGGAAIRAYAGGQDSSALRSQISISNVARECTPEPGGGYTLKIGVEGRVLIGPAGSAGTFSAPVNFVVKSAERVYAERRRVEAVRVETGQPGADFALVEGGISIPGGATEVTITVGLGGGGAQTSARRKR